MPFTIRKIVAAVFLITSSFLSITLGYSLYVYFQVYGTIRNLKITIPEFDVKVTDNSYVFINTTVTIQNPSECPLELLAIAESIHLEAEFIKNQRLTTHGKSIQIPPMSVVNASIDVTVPPHRIAYVKAHLDERWLVTLRIHFKGPMVGIFPYTNYWLITNTTKT